MVKVEVNGEKLLLMPDKAIYMTDHRVLVIADVHLGKINHFRRAGIPLPIRANQSNIERLIDMITTVKPARVVFLGDLFHSHYNQEWEVFGQLTRHFTGIAFELVLGNHDIMGRNQYLRKGIALHQDMTIGSFLLTHHPENEVTGGFYNLAGHVHPGAFLRGGGKQGITLPCFLFGATHGLLPAFGVFTGLARVYPKDNDQVYVVADNRIFSVHHTTNSML